MVIMVMEASMKSIRIDKTRLAFESTRPAKQEILGFFAHAARTIPTSNYAMKIDTVCSIYQDQHMNTCAVWISTKVL